MHNEGRFKTNDGLQLFKQSWKPDGDYKAAIVIVHGYAEHSTRYNHIAEYLVRSGYAVYAFDLRGHGKSGGSRVFISSFNKYLSDLDRFLAHLNKQEPDKPIFLLGHSMGGTIVSLFAITRGPGVNGIILTSPFLKIPDNISPVLLSIVPIISYIFPRLPIVEKLDSALMSRDPRVAASYDNDPLIWHGKMLARVAHQINQAVKEVEAGMQEISLPLFILHGTSDSVASPQGSKDLYARAKARDKTLKLYEGFYHEILNESENDEVLRDLTAWLNAHV